MTKRCFDGARKAAFMVENVVNVKNLNV